MAVKVSLAHQSIVLKRARVIGQRLDTQMIFDEHLLRRV